MFKPIFDIMASKRKTWQKHSRQPFMQSHKHFGFAHLGVSVSLSHQINICTAGMLRLFSFELAAHMD